MISSAALRGQPTVKYSPGFESLLTVLGSNPADSPAYSGLPVLRWVAIWDGKKIF
jgi:hypothetical protein